VTPWKDYQEQAAAFFRSLGLIATTEEHLEGVRGTHEVDVVVRQATAGIGQLWIVECKRWKRSINKLHVAALAEIVEDVGADRGILLSESGFQAGAIRMANSRNITLSSISDLEENSEQERTELGLSELRRRCSKLSDRIDSLLPPDRPISPLSRIETLFLCANIQSSKMALSAAEAGRWPIKYLELTTTGERQIHRAHDASELLIGLNGMFANLENEIIQHETLRSSG
jgi:hypothetical protein